MDDDKQILLAYLESAWRNIQHHDAVRLVFVILYYVLASCCFALFVFVSTVRHEIAVRGCSMTRVPPGWGWRLSPRWPFTAATCRSSVAASPSTSEFTDRVSKTKTP